MYVCNYVEHLITWQISVSQTLLQYYIGLILTVRRRKPGDFIAVFRIFRAFIAGYTGGHPTHFPGRHFCRGEKLSGKNERVYEML